MTHSELLCERLLTLEKRGTALSLWPLSCSQGPGTPHAPPGLSLHIVKAANSSSLFRAHALELCWCQRGIHMIQGQNLTHTSLVRICALTAVAVCGHPEKEKGRNRSPSCGSLSVDGIKCRAH